MDRPAISAAFHAASRSRRSTNGGHGEYTLCHSPWDDMTRYEHGHAIPSCDHCKNDGRTTAPGLPHRTLGASAPRAAVSCLTIASTTRQRCCLPSGPACQRLRPWAHRRRRVGHPRPPAPRRTRPLPCVRSRRRRRRRCAAAVSADAGAASAAIERQRAPLPATKWEAGDRGGEGSLSRRGEESVSRNVGGGSGHHSTAWCGGVAGVAVGVAVE